MRKKYKAVSVTTMPLPDIPVAKVPPSKDNPYKISNSISLDEEDYVSVNNETDDVYEKVATQVELSSF